MHDGQSAEPEDESLRGAAQAGDVEAEYRLGTFAKQSGKPDARAEGGAWWRRAAAAGHAEAMYRLGLLVENQDEELRRLLDNDEASEQDREEDPRTWHRLAAKAGHVEAMVRLAWLLESFPHREEDQVEAVAWSRRL